MGQRIWCGGLNLFFKHLRIYVYTYLFMMTELRKCAGCRSEVLLNNFAINRKGEHNKTCETCLSKIRKTKPV